MAQVKQRGRNYELELIGCRFPPVLMTRLRRDGRKMAEAAGDDSEDLAKKYIARAAIAAVAKYYDVDISGMRTVGVGKKQQSQKETGL